MTCQTENPCSATLTSSPSPDKRVRYGLGMLLVRRLTASSSV